MSVLNTTITLAVGVPLLLLFILPYVVRFIGRLVGNSIRSRTQQRRDILLSRAEEEQGKRKVVPAPVANKNSSSSSLDEDWEKVNAGERTPLSKDIEKTDETFTGIIGFFHPFCNAGGGGERVLFAALKATQQRYPKALCVVYTGDQEVPKEQILTNAFNRFNISIDSARVALMYLSTREFVLASMYPHFTLLGQSLGSLVLGWEAFSLLVPDIYIDTMGYAFTIALCKWLFPSIPTGAYVHYPTISTDMLDSLDDETQDKGLNAGTGKGTRGKVKQRYWKLFAWLYSWVGGYADVVMTNSNWTQGHISSLWGPARAKRGNKHPIRIVYPPCAVEELHEKIPVNVLTESQRTRNVVYIAQFRAEKMHQTVIAAFSAFLKTMDSHISKPKLILCGSVRDDQDEKRVYKLRLEAQEIKNYVDFVINAKWPQVLELLRTSSVGVNAMWNEHFGIGVVEYQAAGLISVVNDSGGPKEDIVVDFDGGPTGFHASTTEDYVKAFIKAFELSTADALAIRERARKSSLRFTEDVFSSAWLTQLGLLVAQRRQRV